ncbi:3-oxoacyl-[acyl-carrier-protein] synthase I, chloroplastic-like protein [Tanacetum coccineum]|uniref:beta-ketoacyl-[acyl-carrier-protein] synthase I n=1 Tax=Tanacetum coccineum TaxID=301880 RepID=A0ABQ5J1L6_9ASTR
MTSSMVMRVDDVINGDESRSGPNTMKPMMRCLIVASMIGSSGLLGNLWPDLDMLQLEWLSEAAIDTGLMGPNYSISTSCATANYYSFNAANHIRRGDAGVMIAGGTEAAANAIGVGGFISCRALSQRNDEPHRASPPWD